jgi:hypothetical protein
MELTSVDIVLIIVGHGPPACLERCGVPRGLHDQVFRSRALALPKAAQHTIAASANMVNNFLTAPRRGFIPPPSRQTASHADSFDKPRHIERPTDECGTTESFQRGASLWPE